MHFCQKFAGAIGSTLLAVVTGVPGPASAQNTPGTETIIERAARAGTVRHVVPPGTSIKRTATSPVELELVFATRSGDYLTDIRVRIVHEDGTPLLDTVADTAFLSVAMPPGRYVVNATFGAGSQSRLVNIDGSRPVSAQFLWGPPAIGAVDDISAFG